MEKQHRFFPNALRLHRQTLGLTQRQVATLLDLHDSVPISQWEKGTKLPNAMNLIKLSLIYHTIPNELYDELFQDFRETLRLKEFEQFQKA
ncbi:helix-turn-helix domain-containing protein [Mucilaginibacter ginsenosidivorans]|uniref:Helix-turn-helix transcriptional regulator n=1 Tax=Mucilaginibacter ginsenosidivorans TaxID=398053 RepID=A0A5B8UTL3_9SPHI|nr:helix-turn-helix transcriptional regulator [Mucilaginibacter ginsenosidivorans]QEC61731.1 helix-turn-helix transcriptional regulator [Mucilaginibacter ginsenosidivorans]